MEREKFDKLIRGKVDFHDQNFSRSYDKEKSWNAISKKRNNKIWYQILAAIAITALGFVLFLHTEHPPVVNEMTKTDRENRVDGSQESVQSLREPMPSTPELAENRPASERNFTVKEFSSPVENVNLDTVSTTRVSNAILNAKTPVRTSADTSTESGDIRITFKRGVQIGDQDIKVSLSRGQKVKLDFFKRQPYDSTAYVLNHNNKSKQSIKLHF